jgi:hypothetical protein
MEYNLFKKGLLATGGNELYIVNLEKDVENPDIFCPYENKDEDRVITDISWNKCEKV